MMEQGEVGRNDIALGREVTATQSIEPCKIGPTEGGRDDERPGYGRTGQIST